MSRDTVPGHCYNSLMSTDASVAARRTAVAPWLAAGLSIREIAARTGIPRSAVHRARQQLEKAGSTGVADAVGAPKPRLRTATAVFGRELDADGKSWARGEAVSEAIIMAIYLLCDGADVAGTAAKLTPDERKKLIHIVGRSPSGYPSGLLGALRALPSR